jgi:adenylylsulfate kinase
MPKGTHIVWQKTNIQRSDREQRNGHRSVIIWFTGLSGAGKSTLANALDQELYRRGCRSYVCDGDNLRHGMCADLGFSETDRIENIRRVGELAKLLLDVGVIAITAFISPYRNDRQKARKLVVPADFIEVYCRCPIAVCEQRDVKGLYQKARAGEISNFTGISAPYEEPEAPEIVLDTNLQSLAGGVARIIEYLQTAGVVPEGG